MSDDVLRKHVPGVALAFAIAQHDQGRRMTDFSHDGFVIGLLLGHALAFVVGLFLVDEVMMEAVRIVGLEMLLGPCWAEPVEVSLMMVDGEHPRFRGMSSRAGLGARVSQEMPEIGKLRTGDSCSDPGWTTRRCPRNVSASLPWP